MTTVYPPVRSFQPRRRALSPTRAVRFQQLVQQWGLASEGDPLDLVELFAPLTDVVLEIGFGGGEGLIAMAAARPEEALIGIDIYTPGAANVVEAIDEHGWSHVRVVEGDVLEFLPRLPVGSLAGVRIWFPDPWLKNKQRHRRLVRPEVVSTLTERLRLGGTLHLATDIADYAAHAQSVFQGEQRLRGGVIPRPDWRPLTRFEQRGLDAGREPTDMIYERVG
ncbi:MAG: tRNA (guanine(46)-N(7))-methyltransferase TrmB [Ilumatobacteraceae bacterium]